MAKQIKQTKSERLENLSFWFTEYAYRNTIYQKWIKASFRLEKILNPYEDVIIEILGKEYPDVDGFNINKCTWKKIKNGPIAVEIEKKCGSLIRNYCYKSEIFNIKFENKFKIITPPIHERITTELYLQEILNHEKVSFSPYSIHEISLILHNYNDWIISLVGYDPTLFNLYFYKDVILPTGPEISLEEYQKAALEYKVLYLMGEATELWGENKLDTINEETADAVLELLTNLKSINVNNTMRLATLWLWDQINAEEDKSLSFDSKFSKHLKELRRRANAAGMHGKPWGQIYKDKGRVMKALKNTDLSIQSMTIRDLYS